MSFYARWTAEDWKRLDRQRRRDAERLRRKTQEDQRRMGYIVPQERKSP